MWAVGRPAGCLRLAKEEHLMSKGIDEMMVVSAPETSTARYRSLGIVERSLQGKICRLFWLLIAISLIPGIALVLSPERWQLLPPGVQWSAYLVSIILMFAAFSLRLSPVGNSSLYAGRESRNEGGSNIDPQLGTVYLPPLYKDLPPDSRRV
jgi:hypothetical protein